VPDLEQELTELAHAIAWPPTPRLLPIHVEVARPARRRGPGWLQSWWRQTSWRRPLAVAVAALLVVAVALVAYPPSRNAIADWVNLHVLVKRVPVVQTPSPLPSGTLGDQLGLGLPYSLTDAQRVVGWRITLPKDLGEPDAIYVKTPPTLGEVTLVYAKAPDIPVAGETGVSVLVTEARGRTQANFFEKTVGPGTTVEPVSVGGRAGYWIAGRPHTFVFLDAEGQPFFDSLRLATNTLIFDRGDGTIVRIEANTTREKAIQIALSLE
jgi:hypothetical protein